MYGIVHIIDKKMYTNTYYDGNHNRYDINKFASIYINTFSLLKYISFWFGFFIRIKIKIINFFELN